MQVGNVLTEGGLIVFGDKEVVSPLVFHQEASRLPLGVQGIGGDNGTVQGEWLEKLFKLWDFVALFPDSQMSDNHRLLMKDSADGGVLPWKGYSAGCSTPARFLNTKNYWSLLLCRPPFTLAHSCN